MKYYVCSKSKRTGRVQIKMTKCTDSWCDEAYKNEHPERVWQFSKQGATNIVEKLTKRLGWGYEYYIVEAK